MSEQIANGKFEYSAVDEETILEYQKWLAEQNGQEETKEEIADRVRGYAAEDKAVIIRAKPKPTIVDNNEKTVAVYARVSTKSDEQISSLENQKKYYTEKIAKTPNWTMYDIFSDWGKSGTSMKHRSEFNRMLAEAKDKNFDLILCASVSRFARNIADCMEQVRLLRTMNPSHPVGVYFETENIYTLDPESNNNLTVHAMLSEWESANKSRRMIISYDQRICTGQYPVVDLLGFRHTKAGNLIIHPEEAKTVRYAFLAIMAGERLQDVARVLTEKKRSTLKGRTEWNAEMVRSLFENERRWGDLKARKTVVIDYVEHKSIKNNQHRDAAFVPGHHKGIVSPEIARAVQMVMSSGRGIRNGVVEITVIPEGTLKGFVSVCPGWSAVSCEMFQTVCRSVYSDEELIELEQQLEGLRRNGEVDRETMSGFYEVPHGVFFMNSNTPNVTLSHKAMKFSRACHTRLDNCEYVEILYHPLFEMIAVRKANCAAANAVRWESEDGKIANLFFAAAFMSAVYEQMDWDTKYSFRFRGITRNRGKGKILFFSLNEPQILKGRASCPPILNNPEMEQTELTHETATAANRRRGRMQTAYPEAWAQEIFGKHYMMQYKQDAIARNISEQDILTEGIAVVNPMIGEIPNRDQIRNEMNALLRSM